MTLRVENLEVTYGGAIRALRGISLSVETGQVVALLGANGAGKTTVLRSLHNVLDLHKGEVTKGTVTYDGHDLLACETADIVSLGLAQVMEGRRILKTLTVEENLRAGALVASARENLDANRTYVLDLFPGLRDHLNLAAGYLSGGQQQMLATARALMSNPKLLVLDEPTLGLSPLLAADVQTMIREVHERGVSVLLVEQNARLALGVADHGYVLENGRVALEGSSDYLSANPEIQQFYLGLHGGERRSIRGTKSYKSKKRWNA